MSLLDEFQDELRSVIHKRLTAGEDDGVGGRKAKELTTIQTTDMLVDRMNMSEQKIAEKYVGKDVMVFIGKPNIDIQQKDYLIFGGKAYEVELADSDVGHIADHGEYIGIFKEGILDSPEYPDVTP